MLHPDRHCRGINTKVFFPSFNANPRSKGNLATIARAKEICEGCPVKVECFRYAMDHKEEGIWGGTTFEEREKMKCKLSTTNSGV